MLLFEPRLALGLERLPTRLSLGGIELRVLRRKCSSGLLEPGVELRTERLDAVGLEGCQVGLLARIGGELIQFIAPILVVMDELPIVLGDDRRRLAALVTVGRMITVLLTDVSVYSKTEASS